ncbi:MAG: Grx4 family monothiol glutaredoxin [Gammaproteobacteria bacterium]|nr:Grx4 family monothiol glutaredoxin [Gammaproteobacteria bacterium]
MNQPASELTTDLSERIAATLERHPVVLFMKGTPDFPQCGFSAQTVGALRDVDARFFAVNVLDDEEMREGLKKYSNWPTFPQLYANGELVGGCDIVLDLHAKGELQKTISSI